MQLDIAATLAMAHWWWTFILRGVIAVAFGIIALLWPGWGLGVLVALFGIWALIEGFTLLLTAFRTRETDRNWWLEMLEGIVSIAAGVVALLLPGFAAGILMLIIAAWAIVMGAFQVYMAIRLREEIRGEFWLGLAGVAAIVFGVATFFFPAVSALSLVWLIGSFAIVYGVFLVILGWRLRRIDELARRDAAMEYPRA